MTDRNALARSSSHLSSDSRAPGSSSIRPRNRRLISTDDTTEDDGSGGSPPTNRASGLLSAFSPAVSRAGSPLSFQRSSASLNGTVHRTDSSGNLGQFLSETWTQSWSSVQGLTTSIFNAGGAAVGKTSSGTRDPTIKLPSKPSPNWGPTPPSQTPGLDDVAAGSLAQREAALKAAKTASVLESHDGVNGGLDIAGKHKRRNSDEVTSDRPQHADYLAYIHKVRAQDTFAGLILRYRCREDVFRRANGLWSRDSVQTRKWVIVPVDACDIRGRPCQAPSTHKPQEVDLLAPTPQVEDEQDADNDFFSRKNPVDENAMQEDETPWTHVRWVQIDSIKEPVEIGRIPQGTMGYFPPRRKKSIRTVSAFSTPRQSLDLSSGAPNSAEGSSSRRPSSLGSRPQLSNTPASTRSRMGSDGADARPAWMRRPGGVGSMSRSVRAPGPGKDYFNSWTSKHIPGLNINELPSMSVMGAESAHFGITKESSGIVESPYEEGRDATSVNRQGTGLDRAAAAVETWLRGALAKRPGTPLRGAGARLSGDQLGVGGTVTGDLIELADTGSEDGRLLGDPGTTLLDSRPAGATSRSDVGGSVRGRAIAGSTKGAKAE